MRLILLYKHFFNLGDFTNEGFRQPLVNFGLNFFIEESFCAIKTMMFAKSKSSISSFLAELYQFQV